MGRHDDVPEYKFEDDVLGDIFAKQRREQRHRTGPEKERRTRRRREEEQHCTH